MTQPFNRKTFDPLNNPVDMKTINVLRNRGRSRGLDYPSSAARQAFGRFPADPKGKYFLDLGCGDSHDWELAEQKGFNAKRMDLFPPRVDLKQDGREWPNFICGDIAEQLPFENNSVDLVICQAVVDPIEPNARINLYREVRRILTPSGFFFINAVKLAAGWGINKDIELASLKATFPVAKSYTQSHKISYNWFCAMSEEHRRLL